VGVDAALLVLSATLPNDVSYVFAAAAAHPGRFGVIAVVEPTEADVDEKLRSWRASPDFRGIRVLLFTDDHRRRLRDGAYEPIFAAAERHEVPIMIFPPRAFRELGEVAGAHPDLQLVVDHFGLAMAPLLEPDADPFESL